MQRLPKASSARGTPQSKARNQIPISRAPEARRAGMLELRDWSPARTVSLNRSKIEEAGYQTVTELKKDDQGIWRAKAQKSGQTVTVGLDFKGNVATQ